MKLPKRIVHLALNIPVTWPHCTNGAAQKSQHRHESCYPAAVPASRVQQVILQD